MGGRYRPWGSACVAAVEPTNNNDHAFSTQYFCIFWQKIKRLLFENTLSNEKNDES